MLNPFTDTHAPMGAVTPERLPCAMPVTGTWSRPAAGERGREAIGIADSASHEA
jgi:hypothetical protein